MAKIYKISIFISLLAVIFVLASYVRAQGKGYFYEQGNNFFILDNLHINGYLAVENKLTNKEGTLGDVLVENNLILDKESVVNFCQDLPANTNCAAKSIVWQSENLDIQDNKLNEIQTNQILAVNKDIYLEPAGSVIATGLVNLQGCFSNDGSGTCIKPKTCVGGGNNTASCVKNEDCPNGSCRSGGELRTANFYTDNLSSLSLRTPGPPSKNSPEIKFTANKIVFNTLDLGAVDHSNVCWTMSDLTQPCSQPGSPPANLGSNYTFTISLNDGTYDATHYPPSTYRFVVSTDSRGKWNFVHPTLGTYPAFIAKDTTNPPTKKLCCYLDVSL
ncbi:MAG: hypothetical protein NTX00_03330 [Candidatus Parcubacteria bacterium]|nr:hypothetical protein [Candidatus Parcubacteria bacterium]